MLKSGIGQIKIAVDKTEPEDIPFENKENKNSDYWEERGRRKRQRAREIMYQSRSKTIM